MAHSLAVTLLPFVKSDLTVRQLAVLGLLLDEPPENRTVRALAANLDVPKTTITRAADLMTELGYVTRRVDPLDRRSVFIEITRDGRALLATANTSPLLVAA